MQKELGIPNRFVTATLGEVERIVAVKRGKACDTCGIVEPHHRPECAGMKAEEMALAEIGSCEDCSKVLHEGDDFERAIDDAAILFCRGCVKAGDGSPDTYDRNDGAAVAAHIDSMTKPNDAPLTPVGAANEGEASS
jgi:hypothetical protein